MKEQLTKLNEQITNIIEMLDYAKDEKQLNIYLNHLWEVTKEIRNIVGSPNSRKNFWKILDKLFLNTCPNFYIYMSGKSDKLFLRRAKKWIEQKRRN